MISDIVDVSKSERGADVAAAAQRGMVAMIAKATQGKDWVDPSYMDFREQALKAGILFGAFHFGSASSVGSQQADWFLAHVDRTALLVLDWENNPDLNSGTMLLSQAETFVFHVFTETKRWPVLYSGNSFLHEHAIPSTSVLGHCPLWLAQYGPEPVRIPSPWSKWDLWQYTNSAIGPNDLVHYPHVTPGLGRKADRSVFRGDLDALKAFWASAGMQEFSQ